MTCLSCGSSPGEDMCPNCVTPWKCNGPHVPCTDTWHDVQDVGEGAEVPNRVAPVRETAPGHSQPPSPTTTETGELVDLLATAIVRTGLGPTEVDAALDALSTLRSRIEELEAANTVKGGGDRSTGELERLRLHLNDVQEVRRQQAARIEELERERDALTRTTAALRSIADKQTASLQEARGLLERAHHALAVIAGLEDPYIETENGDELVEYARTFLSSTKGEPDG